MRGVPAAVRSGWRVAEGLLPSASPSEEIRIPISDWETEARDGVQREKVLKMDNFLRDIWRTNAAS